MGSVRLADGAHRWLWFVALYLASVTALAIVAYGLRALIKAFL